MFAFCCAQSGSAVEHEQVNSPAKLLVEGEVPDGVKSLVEQQPAAISEPEKPAPEPEPAAAEPEPAAAEPEPAAAEPEPAAAEPEQIDTAGLSGKEHYKYPLEMAVPMSVIVNNGGGGSPPGIFVDTTSDKLCLVQLVNPAGFVDQWNKTAAEQNVVKKFDRVCKVAAKATAKSAEELKNALNTGGLLTLSMEHPGEIEVSVKRGGKALGLKCKELELKGLLIQSISAGVIKEMNDSGAIKPPLKENDVIGKVNGRNIYGDEMLKIVEGNDDFTMTVYSYKI